MKDVPGAGKHSVSGRKSNDADGGTAQCLIDDTLGAKKQIKRSDLSAPLPAPCPFGNAVSTMPVVTLVASLIICTDRLRLRRDLDSRKSLPLLEKALLELKSPGERVTDRREGSGTLQDLWSGTLLLHGEPREIDSRLQCNARRSSCFLRWKSDHSMLKLKKMYDYPEM